MKVFAIILMLAVSFVAEAKLPFLPAQLASLVPSIDRQLMAQVQTRAQNEKKMVLLEISAAWCGPCTAFGYDLKNHPEFVTDLSNKGIIFVRGELQKVSVPGIFLDFPPQALAFFPCFWVYSDNFGWRLMGAYNDVASVEADIPRFSQSANGVADWQTQLETAGKAGSNLGDDTPITDLLQNLGFGFSSNYSYADFKTILQLIDSEGKKYPTLDSADFISSVRDINLAEYLRLGLVTLAQVGQDYPDYVANLTDVSAAGIDGVISGPLYGFQMQNLLRTQGPAAALASSDKIWASVQSQLKPGSLGSSDYSTAVKLGGEVQNGVDLLLNVWANGPSQNLQNETKALAVSDSTLAGTDIMWQLEAAVGLGADAAALYHNTFVTNFVPAYNAAIAADNTALATAKATGDATKIAAAQLQLDIHTFQLQHHTDVDTEVEADLNANKPIQVLQVLN